MKQLNIDWPLVLLLLLFSNRQPSTHTNSPHLSLVTKRSSKKSSVFSLFVLQDKQARETTNEFETEGNDCSRVVLLLIDSIDHNNNNLQSSASISPKQY